jgi:hypothetical protein
MTAPAEEFGKRIAVHAKILCDFYDETGVHPIDAFVDRGFGTPLARRLTDILPLSSRAQRPVATNGRTMTQKMRAAKRSDSCELQGAPYGVSKFSAASFFADAEC